jgi:23S rRNA (adenine-N6)-dimethyltransferase
VAVKRGLPWPSTVSGVVWGAWYSSCVARRLSRSAFDPQPSVDAGVLVFGRRARPLVPVQCGRRYGAFVAAGFRHGLRAVAPGSALRKLRVTGMQARDLDAHGWAALFSLAERQ